MVLSRTSQFEAAERTSILYDRIRSSSISLSGSPGFDGIIPPSEDGAVQLRSILFCPLAVAVRLVGGAGCRRRSRSDRSLKATTRCHRCCCWQAYLYVVARCRLSRPVMVANLMLMSCGPLSQKPMAPPRPFRGRCGSAGGTSRNGPPLALVRASLRPGYRG